MLGAALDQRYAHPSAEGRRARQAVGDACAAFLSAGLGDANAEQRLSATDDDVYWQQFSEVLLAHTIQQAGLAVSHPNEGPDFLIANDGRKIWIEVVCPKPNGLPLDWTQHALGTVVNNPHEALLLRWTAAIKEKAEKLLGNPERNIKGYIEKGIVGPDDAYVIAVNGRLLRCAPGVFPELFGISQFPFAVEATFAVGPIQVHIDRASGKVTGSDHQHRPLIPKPNGSVVPAYTFLDPAFAPVSAIWAVDTDEKLLLEKASDMVVVHNPLARAPLSRNLLPTHFEYVATDLGDEYELNRIPGNAVSLGQTRPDA